MLRQMKDAVRRAQERERLRRDYLGLLRLDNHLFRDVGLARGELHDRLDALNVPV